MGSCGSIGLLVPALSHVTSPSASVLFSAKWTHFLLGSDEKMGVQMTLEAAEQSEKRKGTRETRTGPRCTRGRPSLLTPRCCRRRAVTVLPGLAPARMKGPQRLGPFEGAPSHPAGQLETMCGSLEPLAKARVASVYLSLYFNSSNAFLAGGKKNADYFHVKLNNFRQSYTYSINTSIF